MENNDGMLPPHVNAADELNNDPEIGELSLTITPADAYTKSETSPGSPQRSPTKQHANLLNIGMVATTCKSNLTRSFSFSLTTSKYS